MIRIAFRFDDPSETSNQVVERGIVDVLSAHGACATFACIPFRLVDGERISLSRARAAPLIRAAQDGIIEVALHGHSHVRHTLPSALPSEFATRSVQEQEALIVEGSAHFAEIFGKRPLGFVPPWNTFDDASLTALESAGFEYISAGAEHASRKRTALKQLHRTSHLSQIDAVVSECERFRQRQYTSILVMHHYDFFESGSKQAVIDLNGFHCILDRLTEIPDLRIASLADLARTLHRSNSDRLKQYRFANTRLFRRILPRHGFVDAGLFRSLFCR